MSSHINDNQLIDIAYGVFAKRTDGSAPKPCKMLDDRIWWDLVSAEEYACQMEQTLVCKLEVRELRVSVGDVVSVEK